MEKSKRDRWLVLTGGVIGVFAATWILSLWQEPVFVADGPVVVQTERETAEEETEPMEATDNEMREGETASELPPRIALTFDDGPHPEYTPKLLAGLREREVLATFFVVGENVAGNEDIIREMNEDGHLIGNHTYHHVKLKGMNEAEACDEIIQTSSLIREITGKDTEYIRPPFGEWNPQLECGIVMFPIMWNVDPLDWATKNTDEVVNKVVTKVSENDIILLHDYYESSVEAALRIVDLLQAEGYEFVTVDELILE